jgi:Glycosyl hydrolases family 39
MLDRQGNRQRWRIRGGDEASAVGLALLLLFAVLLSIRAPANSLDPPGPTAPAPTWNASVRHRPDPHSFAVGVTHTQYSIDTWGDQQARARAQAVLTATATYQNQHIFGWGALNPEPSPGRYDWSSLDRRMQLIRSTGGTPVITLCCAPDWMKGGRPGETDWRRLEEAPSPQHYDDFAALAAAAARRYRDVRYFQVWNELKGFWNNTLNRWDYEGYTRLYNMIYDALKAVDPSLQIGGPYVVLDTWHDPAAGGHASDLNGACGIVDQRGLSVLQYWLTHKRGAQFVSIDASSSPRDGGASETATAVQTFGVLTKWIRQRTSLPIWWSEFHASEVNSGRDQDQEHTASAVASLLRMATAGASVALIWQPQREARRDGSGRQALWTSTDVSGGGQPLPYAAAIAHMQSILADRAAAQPVSWPRAEVGVLRGRDAVLVVNAGDADITVTINGTRLRLGAYEVRYAPGLESPVFRAARTGRYGLVFSLLRAIPVRPNPDTNKCLRMPPSEELRAETAPS